MICEGTLKDGDLIQSEDGEILKVVEHHIRWKGDNYKKELGSSYLGADYGCYTIMEKPISFMEAIESDKRCSIKSEIISKVYNKCSKSTDIQADMIKNILDGNFYYINSIIYALSGYMGCSDWEELINHGEFYLESEEC
jgi:hypothetical protein